MNTKAYDICECGDYRKQHEYDAALKMYTGCSICTKDAPSPTACLQFRLFQTFVPKWKHVR